jgi:hypothetical protein
MFCTCEIVQLFSLMFCLLRSVHKLDFWLVTNEIPNGDHLEESLAVTETRVLTGTVYVPPTIVKVVRGLYPRFAGQLLSFE